MSIIFDLLIEFYDEDFEELLMAISYHEIVIDFNMYLKDFNLLFDFNTIKMGSAHVESEIITNLKESGADTHVMNYFNWAFMLIIPWANEYHPVWVSQFEIPREVPGFMKIHDISMAIE
jgi:hypothetical protein